MLKENPCVSFYVYIFVPSCILLYISGGVGAERKGRGAWGTLAVFPNVNLFKAENHVTTG